MSYGNVEIKSNSKFLRIENGIPVEVRLLSPEPKQEVIHGFNKDKIGCTGPGCFKCADGNEAKQRFTVEVWNWKLAKRMTWEYGASIAKQLKEIDISLGEESKSINDVDLKITSEGAQMQKKYTVTPRTSGKPLPPEAELPY